MGSYFPSRGLNLYPLHRKANSLFLAAWALLHGLFCSLAEAATLVVVPWLLTAVASLVAEHRPCSTWASVVTGPEL